MNEAIFWSAFGAIDVVLLALAAVGVYVIAHFAP